MDFGLFAEMVCLKNQDEKVKQVYRRESTHGDANTQNFIAKAIGSLTSCRQRIT